MAVFTHSDLRRLGLTDEQTEVLVQHLNAWKSRFINNFYSDMDIALKKLIYSFWSSKELKPFLTKPVSETLIDILLDEEWIIGQLHGEHCPYSVNRWAMHKLGGYSKQPFARCKLCQNNPQYCWQSDR